MMDWMMIVLTFIYVVATIVICYFSYKSAKASNEQTREMRQQYLAENRPYVTVELIYERRAFYGIRLTNHGKRIANHVKIRFDDSFLESIVEPDFKAVLKEQYKKECIIGIGQHYHLYFGLDEFKDRPQKAPILGSIEYSDSERNYKDEMNIDFANYGPLYSVNNDMDDIKQEMRNLTKEIANNQISLNNIAQALRDNSEIKNR